MKKHIISSLITAAVMSSTAVQAESIYDVYKLAKQNDPGLRAAAATYQAQKEGVTVTKGNLYPEISFSGSLGYTNIDSPSIEYDNNSNSLALELNYPIYSPALGYAVDAVEISSASAGVSYENSEEDLALTTLTEYFNLLIAQSTLQTTEALVKSTASQLDRAKKQYEVGLASVTDLQDAQAEYDSVRVTELSARSSVSYAQKALYQRTGRVIESIPTLSADYPIRLDPNMTVDTLIAKAQKDNKELKILSLAVESAENNISIQKSNGRTPTVSITGSLSRTDNDYSVTSSSLTSGATNTTALSLGVSIPLYSGGAINASVRQASAEAESAIEQKASSLQSIELNIRSLYLDLQTAVAQIEAQQQLIRSRNSALEATKAGYDVGTRNLVELLDAQSNLYDAQNTYEQYRYNFVLKQLSLLEATGDLTEDKIKQLDKWLVAQN
ncbi:TolC family outer membrane protein [Marinomonas posidonica]|uniref:Type I secretion outer membrane protein, TolC family n=1 Tax=Marinomonas posidonica (strain CECT 7376 / NCIMB 14433 / IVIA-Po-181) TaxID=491952 RepID=F6CVC3_MARPP|nr:TolC family outer membrane protein [Marinomonas posidonica]AEF54233.1 type I secretion outer membrane protein, TolC family [Marinomonas posidonica IVIA-Po-181]